MPGRVRVDKGVTQDHAFEVDTFWQEWIAVPEANEGLGAVDGAVVE
jgi:hypothetical protein